MKNVQMYQVKHMQEEVERVKAELQKSKSTRERELVRQVDKLMEHKYLLQKQLNSAMLAKNSILKQLEDAELEMEQIQTAARQKVVRSA